MTIKKKILKIAEFPLLQVLILLIESFLAHKLRVVQKYVIAIVELEVKMLTKNVTQMVVVIRILVQVKKIMLVRKMWM